MDAKRSSIVAKHLGASTATSPNRLMTSGDFLVQAEHPIDDANGFPVRGNVQDNRCKPRDASRLICYGIYINDTLILLLMRYAGAMLESEQASP
jgi:hypothetical protein